MEITSLYWFIHTEQTRDWTIDLNYIKNNGDNRFRPLYQLRCNVKTSIQYHTTHLFPGPSSVNTPYLLPTIVPENPPSLLCPLYLAIVKRRHELYFDLGFYLNSHLICRLILQVLYCTIDVSIHNRSGDTVYLVTDTPVVCWILAFVWPLILIPILELIKRREIR